jgi:phage shock protein A
MRDSEALAYRLLLLEQKLESYARLHAEELAEMRRALQGLKEELFSLHQRELPLAPSSNDGELPRR